MVGAAACPGRLSASGVSLGGDGGRLTASGVGGAAEEWGQWGAEAAMHLWGR